MGKNVVLRNGRISLLSADTNRFAGGPRKPEFETEHESLNVDLSHLLANWSYDPTCITARKIIGADGSEKVQLRLDLGIFQMEMDGRPDGRQPHGYETLLHFYTDQEKQHGSYVQQLLDENACAELQQEAVQFYYRYLCMYALNDLPRVIRDTRHNLDLFDLITRHAGDEDVAWQFLQFYTEVKTMNTRAQAEQAANDDQYDLAVQLVKQGLADVQRFWRNFGEELEYDESAEDEELLRELLDEMENKRPRSERETIHAEMQRAIDTENYEQAAQLRDRLRRLQSS